LLKDFLDSYNNFPKDDNQNIGKSDLCKYSEKDQKNIFDNYEFQKNSKYTINCIKCRVSYEELNKTRGGSGFMMPILKEGVTNSFICDLCLMGW